MKIIIIIIFITILIFGCNKSDNPVTNTTPPPSTSGTHVVSVSNIVFNPNSVNAKVGDTIKFVWSSGTHTTTSTSVPSGAATWDSPMTSTNTTFLYIISKAGTYNYQCSIHASMGMTGTFIAN